MKNPNNKKMPTLWGDSVQFCKDWMRQIKIKQLDKYLPEPSTHIDLGLSYAEAYYLNDCYKRYTKAMIGKLAKEGLHASFKG